MLPPPSSPTTSSISSSDLDTESTGSFFHDRSTTLGTLMGVNFPAITTFRAPSQHRNALATTVAAPPGPNGNSKKKKNAAAAAAARRWRMRRRWWTLCRDGDAKPASLGEFLEVERRFEDGAHYDAAVPELEGVMAAARPREEVNGRVLFAEGRVLPPAEAELGPPADGVLCRFTVSLTGICSGGVG